MSQADLRYYVCGSCLAGFREDSRPAFQELELVTDAGTCACGGRFELTDAETALGPNGVFETALRRARGQRPS